MLLELNRQRKIEILMNDNEREREFLLKLNKNSFPLKKVATPFRFDVKGELHYNTVTHMAFLDLELGLLELVGEQIYFSHITETLETREFRFIVQDEQVLRKYYY